MHGHCASVHRDTVHSLHEGQDQVGKVPNHAPLICKHQLLRRRSNTTSHTPLKTVKPSQCAQLTLFGMICSALGVYQESKKDRPSHAKNEALREDAFSLAMTCVVVKIDILQQSDRCQGEDTKLLRGERLAVFVQRQDRSSVQQHVQHLGQPPSNFCLALA